MSALVHCDGPDCTVTRDPNYQARRLGQAGWIHTDDGQIPRDFHDRECLAKWANEGLSSWSTWRNVPETGGEAVIPVVAGRARAARAEAGTSCAGCDQPATHTVGEFDWCDRHGPFVNTKDEDARS